MAKKEKRLNTYEITTITTRKKIGKTLQTVTVANFIDQTGIVTTSFLEAANKVTLSGSNVYQCKTYTYTYNRSGDVNPHKIS